MGRPAGVISCNSMACIQVLQKTHFTKRFNNIKTILHYSGEETEEMNEKKESDC